MSGPSGCRSGLVHVTVTGVSIADVTFYLDNLKVKVLAVPNQTGGRWTLPIRLRYLAFGSHRVQARIDFVVASGTPSRTLRLSFARCRAPAPQFTG
jgi:hypothetical protein